jgi:hypothetical protein|tara:strand:+ start:159 stop:431 length:273 start_codon:yes stop_codon:yes gene_type:complete
MTSNLLKKEVRIEKQIHLVFPAPKGDEKNKEILKSLEEIESVGGEIIVVNSSVILEGYVILPFLETPEGGRNYGVRSIERYATNYSKSKK